MLKFFARRDWVWKPLLGGVMLPLVWASVYCLGLLLLPQIWGDRRAIGAQNLIAGAFLLQVLLGIGFGAVVTLAWWLHLRWLPLVAGMVGTAFGGWMLRGVIIDYGIALRDPVATAFNMHDAMTFAPALVCSLGLVLVGICARKRQRAL